MLGTINIASREALDNLVLVINCNLQRLDGPVRGNGKIIQELERSIPRCRLARHQGDLGRRLGSDPRWRDEDGILQERMEQAVDGDYQMYTVSPGDAVREHWVETSPELEGDDEVRSRMTRVRAIKRGGQDRKKIYAAFEQAMQASPRQADVSSCSSKPSKATGSGPAQKASNTAHQYKIHDAARNDAEPWRRSLGIPLDREAQAAAGGAFIYRRKIQRGDPVSAVSTGPVLGGFRS